MTANQPQAVTRSLDGPHGHPHANVFPDAEPKTIRLTLAAGESVPAHAHPDREIVCYLVEGTMELTLETTAADTETYELDAGDVIRFDGDQQISPRAIEASVAVIVLAPRSTPAE